MKESVGNGIRPPNLILLSLAMLTLHLHRWYFCQYYVTKLTKEIISRLIDLVIPCSCPSEWRRDDLWRWWRPLRGSRQRWSWPSCQCCNIKEQIVISILVPKSLIWVQNFDTYSFHRILQNHFVYTYMDWTVDSGHITSPAESLSHTHTTDS